jgi:hypothetical protein
MNRHVSSPQSRLAAAECSGSHETPDRTPRGSGATYFQQFCPTCGRCLMIRVEHLGRRVFCTHCRGPLVARSDSPDHGDDSDPGASLLARAERLLAQLESAVPRRPIGAV